MRSNQTVTRCSRAGLSVLSIFVGLLLIAGVIAWAGATSRAGLAAPIPPPEGYPKLSLSVMEVTPTLAEVGGATLTYTVQIRNTGAYTAANTSFTDVLPEGVEYKTSNSSVNPQPNFLDGVLTWQGEVGFDASVFIHFSVTVSPELTGLITNQAIIDQADIAKPVTVTAETIVVDHPVLVIEKSAEPEFPGANRPLTYTIGVSNQGQMAVDLPITVTDRVPISTTNPRVGKDGTEADGLITWTRHVTLSLGETTWFTFSVKVGNVPSGTVISNSDYKVAGEGIGVSAGDPYTKTVITPVFKLAKQILPDPPGSNADATYLLTVLNKGSLATGLVITDRVPDNVGYVTGGVEDNDIVTWKVPMLDTGEVAQVSYTVSISDVYGIIVNNDQYGVCSDDGTCETGPALASQVQGPTFLAQAFLDPIAKKPGKGNETTPVTPTLVLRNLGPGNAFDVTANLQFGNMGVSTSPKVIPPIGTVPLLPGPPCTNFNKCNSYLWTGDLLVGEAVTFTVEGGTNTIIGKEGNPYTATINVTDTLASLSGVPITATATAVGHVTKYPHLVPVKSAPSIAGRGQNMTYLIDVRNSGLSTSGGVWLTDTVPMSLTLVNISDGGETYTNGASTIVKWTLPAMSTGEALERSFTVKIDDNVVSGTQIVNKDYYASWSLGGLITPTIGVPVTTTVKEVGLYESYKQVTPRWARPGPNNVLTYTLNVVNTSEVPLTGVVVNDTLPWEHATYLRDAVASVGEVISDIVSFHWTGDVPALGSQVLTYTVLVDDNFEGVITNTAVITHPSLLKEITVHAVTYITNKPVLFITKSAPAGPLNVGNEMQYTIHVQNLGQQATSLVVQDKLPVNGSYVVGSASSGGTLTNGKLTWNIPVLQPGGQQTLTFKVKITGGAEVVNSDYSVSCAEGVTAVGEPVRTELKSYTFYLPKLNRTN